ncbi:transporter [Salinisphaera orenii MK-B5]|uniref:Transporter n=2 Tax=Salinisphaera orenii TaxID=856731 RepID=A0A423PV35_9GAMM|nr:MULTISPECIES: TolC family protein [Salinisphaera]ROO29458.1 transporter [Salinisphaera orenii MK-B5]ROO31882.1 transporter [Salinisphaera halophila YIM 95161]
MSRRIAALAGLLLATSAASLTAAAVEADNLVLPPELTEVGARGTLDLSVEEAVALAIQHNASLRAERQQPIIAGTFAAVERAVFDPSVFATVERSREVTERVSEDIQQNFDVRSEQETARAGLRQTLPTGTELEISLEQDLSESNRSPRQAGTRAGLSITQALLRGFGIDTNLVALRQARADVQASAYELRGFVTSLVADVESTYWDYLGARRRIDILENALEVARRQSREARARIEAGTVAEVEEAAFAAEAARRRQDLIDGRAEARRLRTRLLQLISVPGRTRFERAIEPTTPVATEAAPLDTAGEYVDLARRRRPEINQARLELARNELEVVATRNGLLPRLDLFVTLGQTGFGENYGRAYDTLDNRNTYDLSGALEFEYPLGNRAARARDRRARAGRRQAEASLENLAGVIESDVRYALIEADRAAAQIEASAVTVRERERTLEAERARFEVGRSTALLVAQAQRDLLTARLDRIDAFIGYRQALIELYVADGTLLTRRLIEAPGDRSPTTPWRD